MDSESNLQQYRGKVLFVDDAKVNLMMGRKLLSNFGLEVDTAENGKQAIACCEKNTYQLIFMDLEMPEVGGLAAATIIREKQLSYAPIFALTGTDSEKIRMLCRTANMNGFVTKPLKKEKIEQILNRVF